MSESIYLTKNRIVAVDIARITAAMAVMVSHIYQEFPDSGKLSEFASFLPNCLFGWNSGIFLLLAGYFASRNLTWKKALTNAWWSFAPFILWNIVMAVVMYSLGTLNLDAPWLTYIGCNNFICYEWGILPDAARHTPLNGPLWFMRDLIFLFLLSPILFKWCRWILPALLVASFIPALSAYFKHGMIGAVMSPFSLTYFVVGCFLRSLSKEWQQKILNYCNLWIIIPWLMLMLWRFAYPEAMWMQLMCTWVFYQSMRWLELHLPLARSFALKFAPVTFLTFAGHMPLFGMLASLPLSQTHAVLLYPLIVFILMSLFFFALKRWARPLLHLVAHYKLRPDDIKPTT